MNDFIYFSFLFQHIIFLSPEKKNYTSNSRTEVDLLSQSTGALTTPQDVTLLPAAPGKDTTQSSQNSRAEHLRSLSLGPA